MKYTQSEKMEIIRMVEESSLSVQQTLREMDVPHSLRLPEPALLAEFEYRFFELFGLCDRILLSVHEEGRNYCQKDNGE